MVADAYVDAGFTAVAQDVILGGDLARVVGMFRSRPLYVIVLAPTPEAIANREAARDKKAYGTWTVAQLDDILRRETPRLGLWLDSSAQTPEETVAEILARANSDAAL